VRCIACGQDALRLGGRAELEEFLVAVDAVIAFEHASDERERAVKALLVEDTLTRCAITIARWRHSA
jgi:hypothetical protein